MTKHSHSLSSALSPKQILGLILLIVFVAEVSVMFLLPMLLPSNIHEMVRAVVDSTLLTLMTAPVLWWVIIGPLRMLAAAERTRAASIVEAAADAIVTTDGRGMIESFNTAAEHVFGYRSDEAIGLNFTALVESTGNDQSDRELMRRFLADPQGTAGAHIELVGVRQDGTVFPMRMAMSEVYLGDRHVYTAIIRDLTEQKRAELRQRERDIAKAEQLAVVAQLATGVAHELRNPLTSIKLLVQNSREELASRGIPDDDLDIIGREVKRMERSLQTFLEFSRPTLAAPERIAIGALVDQLFLLVEGRAFQQSVVCVKTGVENDTLYIKGDRDQIQQLLLNLILNALDVMPNGGTLEVNLSLVDDGQLELRVIDSGPGISQKILPRLFEPFVTSKETGVGIGLLISRRIAREHGGDLSAYNQSEGGACLLLRLPLSS